MKKGPQGPPKSEKKNFGGFFGHCGPQEVTKKNFGCFRDQVSKSVNMVNRCVIKNNFLAWRRLFGPLINLMKSKFLAVCSYTLILNLKTYILQHTMHQLEVLLQTNLSMTRTFEMQKMSYCCRNDKSHMSDMLLVSWQDIHVLNIYSIPILIDKSLMRTIVLGSYLLIIELRLQQLHIH